MNFLGEAIFGFPKVATPFVLNTTPLAFLIQLNSLKDFRTYG
jgi:hypothetical protein